MDIVLTSYCYLKNHDKIVPKVLMCLQVSCRFRVPFGKENHGQIKSLIWSWKDNFKGYNRMELHVPWFGCVMNKLWLFKGWNKYFCLILGMDLGTFCHFYVVCCNLQNILYGNNDENFKDWVIMNHVHVCFLWFNPCTNLISIHINHLFP